MHLFISTGSGSDRSGRYISGALQSGHCCLAARCSDVCVYILQTCCDAGLLQESDRLFASWQTGMDAWQGCGILAF